MNKPTMLLLLCSLLFSHLSYGQTVTSVAKSPDIQDGLYVSPLGHVYTTCGGLVNKTTIGRYDPETDKFEVVSNDMSGSIDIASLDGKVLYVTNYDDNSVKRFDVETGKTENLATELDGPAGIEIDKEGNLYVTNFGAPPTYRGNSIYKISPDGKKEVLIEDEQLFRPQGMGWFDDNRLIVANSTDGKLFLFDVNTKELKLFVNTGLNNGNIAIGRGHIYIASNRGNRVLELNRNGDVTATFGTGEAGIVDGPVAQAKFASPLGLDFSPDQKKLYVAQIQNGTLRCITFEN